MAFIGKVHILKDSTKDATIMLVGNVDAGTAPSTDPANTTIVVSSLYGVLDANNNQWISGNTKKPYYETTIRSIEYCCGTDGGVGSFSLNWRGSNANSVIVYSRDSGSFLTNRDQEGVIGFDASGVTAANSGEIFVSATGVTTGNYTFIVHLRKNPRDYQSGQYNDPNAFKNDVVIVT